LWPDYDEPGAKYATDVSKYLAGIAASIRTIDIAAFNLPHKGDAVDYFKAGGTLEGIELAIAGATAANIEIPAPVQENSTNDMYGGSLDTLEPEPLRATLPPAEPFPVDELGVILGVAARTIHETVKAPLALCCQSVLAAASLAAQAHFDIKLPWGERKPLSLFFLTVGESGERKSGVDDLVLGAAKVQERADMEAYALEQQAYETELSSWTQATDAARKAVTSGKKGVATATDVRIAVERCGEKPTSPIAPLRFVSDPTVEGLYKLLVTGQPSVALFSDEGGLLIGGHALNSDNALKTMARWCKLWDGSPFDRVRAGDGAGVLYGRRMCLHQLAQPDVMTQLLSDRMANGQGLLARCLVAWPESTISTRLIDRFEWAGDRAELKRLFAVFKNLLEAERQTDKAKQELDPIELPLTDEAKELAVAAGNQFEKLMAHGAELAELRDRTSKALENACRIAGVLSVIECGLSVRAIERSYLERALILMQWYLVEALRIRGAAAISQSVLDAEMLSAWLRERGIMQFRSKQILRTGPNQLRNKTRLMAAIEELVTNGYLAENQIGALVDGVSARKSWRVLHHVV
jgi:putative DNA primase/helicase